MRAAIIAALVFSVSSLASASASVDLGLRANYTPYDPFLGPVKRVLQNIEGQNADLPKVRRLLREGNRFRYHYVDPYLAAEPEMTARRRAGDCKAKSLWLCDRLRDPSVRYVIGKAHRSSRISHAWVMWKDGRNWWILDPTNKSVPIRADHVSSDRYIPHYSISKSGTYKHRSAQTLMAQVAVKMPVASRTQSTRYAWRGAR